jgi:hypothetical protein
MSHRKLERHDGSVEPATQELEEWTFSVAGKGVPSDERTDVERSTDLAAHEPSEEALDGWEFGIAEERSDRSEPSGSKTTDTGTPSTFEERLAPIVGLLVVGSLLLAGGYILVMTV